MRHLPMNTAASLFVVIAIGGAAAAEGEYYAGAQLMPVLFPVDDVVTGGPAWGRSEQTRRPTSRDNRQQNDDARETR
jgi:hypothetical protein